LPSPSTSAYAKLGRPPLTLVPKPSAVDGEWLVARFEIR
jgi:hypothetical protein